MGKMAIALQKMCPRAKLLITDPLKVWVSAFQSVNGNGKLVSAITKNGKNGHSSPKMLPRVKVPITDHPKLWVSGFLSVNRNGKLLSAIMKNGKNVLSSPKKHPKAKLPITDPPRFTFYPTSHLYVILHFLIFHLIRRKSVHFGKTRKLLYRDIL